MGMGKYIFTGPYFECPDSVKSITGKVILCTNIFCCISFIDYRLFVCTVPQNGEHILIGSLDM